MLKKLRIAGVFSVGILLILASFSGHFYYPVEVKLEIRTSNPENCQLFYTDYRGFNGGQSFFSPYQSEGGFSTVCFSLPKRYIKNLRIDPGFHSEFYEIRKIEIRTAKESISWQGAEILKNFVTINIQTNIQDSDPYLRLNSNPTPDVQLILMKPLSAYVTTINKSLVVGAVILLITIWIAGLILIFSSKSKHITYLFKNFYESAKKRFLYLQAFARSTENNISQSHAIRRLKNLTKTFLESWLSFTIFFVIMIFDRIVTLKYFGFVYTDIDQTVIWNGAMDYSNGVFHEPFFYGQNYNFMLESLLAVPLLWMNIPVYMALPCVTTTLSLIPFIALAVYFRKSHNYFWACLSLAMPVILPIEFNFFTTISRGIAQPNLFIPLLLLPLFRSPKANYVTILYISAAICFIANQSSAIIIVPFFFFIYASQYKSLAFYIKSLWIIPFFLLYFMGKYYYIIHPEKVLLPLSGLNPSIHTLLTNLKNISLFNNLFPLIASWGYLNTILLTFLLLVALFKKLHKEAIFIATGLAFLIFTFSVPKVHVIYEGAGIFYNSSRFYLFVPILLILSLFFVFKNSKYHSLFIYPLLLLSVINFTVKNLNLKQVVERTISETVFPVAENRELIKRVNRLKEIAEQFKVEFIVHHGTDWNYVFDSYTFNPLTQNRNQNTKPILSVNISGDRRTWIYQDTTVNNQILLNGIEVELEQLKLVDYEILNEGLIIIKNNHLTNNELFDKLNLRYGNLRK
jgi:hypothetical protein